MVTDIQELPTLARKVLDCLQLLGIPGKSVQTTVSSQDVSPSLREPYIETGYRRPYKNKSYYWESLFQIHNETINIWSHLLGTVLLLYKLAETTKYVDYVNDPNGLAILAFSLGAIECAFLSALAHWMHSRSEYHHFKYFQIDYIGVSLNSQGIGIFYLFFTGTKYFYLTYGTYLVPTVHVLICFLGFVAMCYAKVYCAPESTLRIALNIGQAVISSLYLGIPLWFKLAEVTMGGDWNGFWRDVFPQLLHYLILAIGGIFYGARIPEVFMPGKFDIVGHGHQIFHIFLTVMSFYQFNCIVDLYQRRSPELTALAKPTIWNTVVLHVCLLVSNILFLLLTTKYTKERAKREFSTFKKLKEKCMH